jgi:hypothetical protein
MRIRKDILMLVSSFDSQACPACSGGHVTSQDLVVVPETIECSIRLRCGGCGFTLDIDYTDHWGYGENVGVSIVEYGQCATARI